MLFSLDSEAVVVTVKDAHSIEINVLRTVGVYLPRGQEERHVMEDAVVF